MWRGFGIIIGGFAVLSGNVERPEIITDFASL